MSFVRLSWLALATTLAVIVWGAYVRATGSGAGCGSHWPTCHGEVVPRAPSEKTLIEFVHRATSGIAFVVVLAQFIASRVWLERGQLARVFASAALVLMVAEAGVGAALVLFEYVADDRSTGRAVWMSVHLVNTFALLGALTATLHTARWPREKRWQWSSQATMPLCLLASLLVVGVSGALAALGDTLFRPTSLKDGLVRELSAAGHLLERLRVLHPVVGLFALALAIGVASRTFQNERARRAARLFAAAFVVQVGLGFLNMALLAPVALQLVHLFVADAVWLLLVVLVLESGVAVSAPVAA